MCSDDTNDYPHGSTDSASAHSSPSAHASTCCTVCRARIDALAEIVYQVVGHGALRLDPHCGELFERATSLRGNA
jgi:hypothetical protein